MNGAEMYHGRGAGTRPAKLGQQLNSRLLNIIEWVPLVVMVSLDRYTVD